MTAFGMLGSPEVMVGITESFGTCRPLDPVHPALKVDDRIRIACHPHLAAPGQIAGLPRLTVMALA